MKKVKIICLMVFLYNVSMAQHSGNINYNNPNASKRILSENKDPRLQINPNSELTFSVKGIYNAVADDYIAVFTVIQSGKTVEETNHLISSRIKSLRNKISGLNADVEVFTDAISFVPLYEHIVEKKLFSKRTYNEIPRGFEQKVNLHIKFKDASISDSIIQYCAQSEIYDLVRIDYIVDNYEEIKDSLRLKAKKIFNKKLAYYQSILNIDLKTKEKMLADGFELYYPLERYFTYQAFSSNRMNIKRRSNVNSYNKSTSMHYMPIPFKSHDFEMNPGNVEPTVQIIYELKVKFILKDKKEEVKKEIVKEKEFYIITNNGNVKKISLQ